MEIQGLEFTNFVNLTPHTISIQLEDAFTIHIPPSGKVARVAEKSFPSKNIITHFEFEYGDGEQNHFTRVNTFHVPTVGVKYGEIENLPEPSGCTMYVVSGLVREAAKFLGRMDVCSPDTGPTCIRENGIIKAVTRFIVNG